MITGKDFIEKGATPGRWFSKAIDYANTLFSEEGDKDKAVQTAISELQPPPPLALKPLGETPFTINASPQTEVEQANIDAATRSMREVLRTPHVIAGTLLPDACPAGPIGTIPVGGVVASPNIHPGMHSADVCCSVYATFFGEDSGTKENLAVIMDALHNSTHFGAGGRENPLELSADLTKRILDNSFTKEFIELATKHMGTQGDGNHFAFVGVSELTGKASLVTHHGSRGFGASVYKKALRVAQKFTKEVSPNTLPQNAWIPAGTDEFNEYWEALQIIRMWTYENHRAIHTLTARESNNSASLSFWNEHNFVFRKEDEGLFYHAKGATPAFGFYSGVGNNTLVPLTMADPILVLEGFDNPNSLGFAPHGAGRNMSRTEFKSLFEGIPDEEIFARETKGIDARFFSGNIDISELPSAYKSAKMIESEIKNLSLGEVVDRILPYGSIMAGMHYYSER